MRVAGIKRSQALQQGFIWMSAGACVEKVEVSRNVIPLPRIIPEGQWPRLRDQRLTKKGG